MCKAVEEFAERRAAASKAIAKFSGLSLAQVKKLQASMA